MMSYDEALSAILSKRIEPLASNIPVLDSIGNFLSADIISDRNYPPFNRASVDGVAFYWDGMSQMQDVYTIKGTVFAGQEWTALLLPDECIRIMTGAPVPKFLNMLVRVEDIINEQGMVVFKRGLTFKHMQNIATEAEDLNTGETVLKKGTRITVQQTGTLASLGYDTVPAYQSLQTAIIRTGDEIIEPGQRLRNPSQIRDSNSFSIRSLLHLYPIAFDVSAAKDTLEGLITNINSKKESDILILTGGVSAGDADFVPKALEACGFIMHFHKVRIKPGKPIWFGTHPNGCVTFGLPGNPYSVQVGVKIFVEPFIRACFKNERKPFSIRSMAHDRFKKISFDEFVIGKKVREGVSVLKHNGSGDITAALHSDGIVRHPADTDTLSAGDPVEFYPWIRND